MLIFQSVTAKRRCAKSGDSGAAEPVLLGIRPWPVCLLWLSCQHEAGPLTPTSPQSKDGVALLPPGETVSPSTMQPVCSTSPAVDAPGASKSGRSSSWTRGIDSLLIGALPHGNPGVCKCRMKDHAQSLLCWGSVLSLLGSAPLAAVKDGEQYILEAGRHSDHIRGAYLPPLRAVFELPMSSTLFEPVGDVRHLLLSMTSSRSRVVILR